MPYAQPVMPAEQLTLVEKVRRESKVIQIKNGPEFEAIEKRDEFAPYRKWRAMAARATEAQQDAVSLATKYLATEKETHDAEVASIVDAESQVDPKAGAALVSAERRLEAARKEARILSAAANREHPAALACFDSRKVMDELQQSFAAQTEAARERLLAALAEAEEAAADIARHHGAEIWALNPRIRRKRPSGLTPLAAANPAKSAVPIAGTNVLATKAIKVLRSVGDRESANWIVNGSSYPDRDNNEFKMPVGRPHEVGGLIAARPID